MTEEIPIWVNGIIQWISGVDRKTTCRDVIEALLVGEGSDKNIAQDYAIMERWRRVERPLDENSKILKIWSHWGDEKKEVRLCLKRINNDIDSGRGSPVGMGSTPSMKRRRHHRSRTNGKPPWGHQETLHPKRLAELGGLYKEEYEEYQMRKLRQTDNLENRSENDSNQPIYDSRHCSYGRKADDSGNLRKKSGHKSYHCAGTGILHSTLLAPNEDDYSKPTTSKCCSKRQKSKVRNSENIEKLMKLILAQGATIQSQLQKLKEREEQIESLENERHRERIEKNGRNYLLETYLGSLKEAEIPATEEERGNDSGIHTEGGSDQTNPTWEKNKHERLQEEPNKGHAERSGECSVRSKRVDLNENVLTESNTKTLPSRSKRSRSEGRTGECRWEDKDSRNALKRTLSDNTLAERCEVTAIGSGDDKESILEDDPKSDANDVLELRRIQSQLEMWEKVFRINKKLEKEEENLVRLHIKIKRFQAESVKYAKDQELKEAQPNEDQDVVEQDLENLRKDLDQNSKEIYQNFTKIKEKDEVVQKKRTILNRLVDDLEKTEQEHSILSEMVLALPEEAVDEERTSFSDPDRTPEIVPIRLSNTPGERRTPTRSEILEESAHVNQRLEEEKPQIIPVKPKNVKISFDDRVLNSESSIGGQEKKPETTAPTTIKGILKNRNSNVERSPTDSFPKLCDDEKDLQENQYVKYPVTYSIGINPAFRETPNYYRPSPRADADPKNIYVTKFQRQGNAHGSDPGAYPVGMTAKTSINDTDSSTSSDTSGLCSMYSSSPTAEEPYAEPAYVLDTLV